MDSLRTMVIGKAICARLRKGPHTAESLAALLCVDLGLVVFAVNSLERIGRVRRNGVLVELMPPRRAT